MPLYESVFIARQDISSSQAEGLMDTFAEIITSTGGSVSKKEYWGLRNLAYRIKKNRKGHYALLNIDAPSAAISEMERNMRLHDDILRYLTVKVDELSDEPSPILRSREERGGRGGRGRRDFGDRPPPRRDDRPAPAASTESADKKAPEPAAEAPKAAEQGEET